MYKWYLAKPFQAVQLNRFTVNELSLLLHERFVFYGVLHDGTKVYDEDLSVYSVVGGYYYVKGQGTKKLNDGDYVVVRNGHYDVVTQEYFTKNFIEIF